MRLSLRTRAILGLAGLSVLCGIGVHLIAELAGLGWRDADLIFSARHIPLAVLAVAALAAVGSVGFAGSGPGGSDRIASIVRSLPGPGGELRFFLVTFCTQFIVFGLTEAGEGLPIQAGDLGPAIVAALFASALGALLVARYKARVIEAVVELFVVILAAVKPAAGAQSWKRIDAHVRVWRSRAVTFAASRRPPPFVPVIDPYVTKHRSQELHGVQSIFAHTRARCGHIDRRACSRYSVSC